MVRAATIKMVLHIATVLQWDVRQFDVKNAFLHGDLHETVYMKQPTGFVDKDYPNHEEGYLPAQASSQGVV